MSHRALMLSLILLWTAAYSAVGRAQAPTAAPSTAAPASGQAGAPSAEQQTPAKKVWTNDDVSELHDQSVISTFGTSTAKSSTPSQRAGSKGKDAKWYREQISKLQGKIPPLDDQIAELQAAIEGKPTGNAKESVRPRGVKADSWPVERDELQKQRGAILSQIAALYDDARHNGIPDGALPLQQ